MHDDKTLEELMAEAQQQQELLITMGPHAKFAVSTMLPRGFGIDEIAEAIALSREDLLTIMRELMPLDYKELGLDA